MAGTGNDRSVLGARVYIGVLCAALVIAAWWVAISAKGVERPADRVAGPQVVPTTPNAPKPAVKPGTDTQLSAKPAAAEVKREPKAAHAPAVAPPGEPPVKAGGPKVTVIDLPVRPVEAGRTQAATVAPAARPAPTTPPQQAAAPGPGRAILEPVAMLKVPGAEIIACDPETNMAFVTCTQGIAVVKLGEGANAAVLRTIDAATDLGAGAGAEVTHVAIDPAGRGILAATVIPEDRAGVPGQVVFLSTRSGAVLARVTVGYGPDAAAFSPDGSLLVVVNEGEARPLARGGLNDPPGSVSVIDLSGVDTSSEFGRIVQERVATRHFDGPALRAALSDSDRPLRIHPANGSTPSLDLEPESVVIVGSRAYITLQENNAIAVLDLETLAWLAIAGLDSVDRELDPSDQDGPRVRATVASLPMPDQIAAFNARGRTLLAVAEEGDDRGLYGESPLGDQARLSALASGGRLDPATAAGLDLSDTGLGRLHVCAFTGDTTGDGLINRAHALGARSLGIYDARTLQRVSDTGSQFERMLGERLTGMGREAEADARSDRRGPEPEGVVIATVGERPIAFVTLERPGAIAIVDLDDPERPRVLEVVPTVAHGGVGPEGLAFIPGASRPNGRAVLLVAFEASDALGVYQVNEAAIAESVSARR